jgi:hypothetical protein
MSPQAPRTTMEAKIRDFVLGQMWAILDFQAPKCKSGHKLGR